jgi:hypothetical protein
MSLRNLGRTAALFVIVACTSVAFAVNPADCQASASDESQVVEALRTMYAAAATDDLVRFHSVVSEKFYAFDGGKRFDGDALTNLIKTLHAAETFTCGTSLNPKSMSPTAWPGLPMSTGGPCRTHTARITSCGWNPLFYRKRRDDGESTSFTVRVCRRADYFAHVSDQFPDCRQTFPNQVREG